MQGTVKTLQAKYADRLAKVNYKKKEQSPSVYLFQSWAYRVEKGWYGFALYGAPYIWGQIIDDFLKELEKFCPKFKILQVKTKFGGLRLYVKLNTSSQKKRDIVSAEVGELTKWLYNPALVY